jgi:hypothetical protein
MFFSIAGSMNPYSIINESDCLTNALLPYILPQGSSKCLRFKFKPTSSTLVDNVFIIYWNGGLLRSFALTATVITPTPTVTPTSSPTPTP